MELAQHYAMGVDGVWAWRAGVADELHDIPP